MSVGNAEAIRERVKAVPFWWHSVDLGEGIVTPGHKTRDLLWQELASLRLPALTGKTVLDIGAWDGYYSFEPESGGAARKWSRSITTFGRWIFRRCRRIGATASARGSFRSSTKRSRECGNPTCYRASAASTLRATCVAARWHLSSPTSP